jgi:citrate lyase subunit beta / citryl-CoA lyase
MVFIPDSAGASFLPRRSILFMPVSNERALAKAPDLDCDAIILDLEDALADGDRVAAHERLAKDVERKHFGHREIAIRTTASNTSTFKADLDAALAFGPDAILLPKVDDGAEIRRVRAMIDGSEARPAIWAMIEAPQAIMRLAEIASAGSGLAALTVGPNDLSRLTGTEMTGRRSHLHPWLMMIIAAARANGLAVFDGVYNNFRDIEGFTSECEQGRAMGFDGKTLIHPHQIAAANKAFGPSGMELDRARQIVETYEQDANRDKNVLQINGEMVERLHYRMARKFLDHFDQPSNKGTWV